MKIDAVLDQLMEASVSVWLDAADKLLIEKGAPDEIKQLVREHKQELIDVNKAIALLNAVGVRIIRLPLGQLALAYPMGANLDEIRWAAHVLRMDSMPLVIDDQGLRSMTWDEWKLRRRVWNGAEQEHYPPQSEPALASPPHSVAQQKGADSQLPLSFPPPYL